MLYVNHNDIFFWSAVYPDKQYIDLIYYLCRQYMFVFLVCFLLLITFYTQWFYIDWNSNFRFIYTYYMKKVPRNRNYYLQLQHAFLKNPFVAFHSTSLEYSTANGLWWRKITKAIRYLLNEERVFTTFPGFRAQSKPPAAS